MYAPRKHNTYKLTQQQVAEIHYLATEGCPACKCSVPIVKLANKYNTTSSTVSRIKNGHYDIPDYEATPLGKVELKKKVMDVAG